jgi:hypothetical protein
MYRVTHDSERQTAFIVHREEFGLPNMVFDMHPCGLHIYYPQKIDGQYGFVQTVADNMKLFTKRQIEGALKAHHHYETHGYPSNADFESVLRAGGIGGCTLTVDDAMVANKIWGDSVPRLKGSTVRETGKRKPQCLVKVPRELIQLQRKVRIGIDIFFVNGHIFFMTYSRMICFTTVTHLINHKVVEVWAVMHKIYQMYASWVSHCRNSWQWRVCLDCGSGSFSPNQPYVKFGRCVRTCWFDRTQCTFSERKDPFDSSFFAF